MFAVGDSQLQTNPMYGRGCASAFVQANVLAEVLRDEADPQERARRYYARSRELLQPYFDLSVATDRMYRRRAKLRRGARISLPERILNYAYEKAWLPATHRHPLLAREFLRSVQMREVSGVRVRVVSLWLLFAAWVQGWFRAPQLPDVTPPREEFLRRVGVNVRLPDSK